MSTYKAIRKNPSAPQADAEIIAALRDIPVALLSDNMHRNSGTVGLQPYHRPAPMAGTAVTVRTRGGDNLDVPARLRVLPPRRRAGGRCRRRRHQRGGRRHPVVLRRQHRRRRHGDRRRHPRRRRDPRARLPGLCARRHPPRPVQGRPGRDQRAGLASAAWWSTPATSSSATRTACWPFPHDEAAELIEKAHARSWQAEAKTIQAMREGRWDRSFIDALEARCNN